MQKHQNLISFMDIHGHIYRERTRTTLIFVIKPRGYETQIYSNNDIPDKRLNSVAVAHYTYFANTLPTINKEYIIRLYLLCSLRGEGGGTERDRDGRERDVHVEHGQTK